MTARPPTTRWGHAGVVGVWDTRRMKSLFELAAWVLIEVLWHRLCYGNPSLGIALIMVTLIGVGVWLSMTL